jgi:hypothetical protein
VTRRPLPLVTPGPTTGPHGSRSHMTCRYKCGNACDLPVPNTSANEHVRDVITTALARRSVLGGALALSAVSGFAPAAATGRRPSDGSRGRGGSLGAATFAPVAPNTNDDVTGLAKVFTGWSWGVRVICREP